MALAEGGPCEFISAFDSCHMGTLNVDWSKSGFTFGAHLTHQSAASNVKKILDEDMKDKENFQPNFVFKIKHV